MGKLFIPSTFHRAEEQNETLYNLLYKTLCGFLKAAQLRIQQTG